MSKLTCAISGLTITCSHLDTLNLSHMAGYYHPVFAASNKTRYHLYSKHCKGELTSTDSYLLFLAFLHSSEQLEWATPVALDPDSPITKKLIENNLAQLVRVLEQTACILHPSFIQPSFKVTLDNSRLEQIPNWIRAWTNNLTDFKTGLSDQKTQEQLQEIENRLSYLILSGEKPEVYTDVIASWADKAAEFPSNKAQEWKKIIRTCFSTARMISTPLTKVKEIKEFCEVNIEAGSIHFHSLMQVLKKGIANHMDYLGGSTDLGYVLLSTNEAGDKKGEGEVKNDTELASIAITAPKSEPVEKDYATSLAFLKARLAYKVAKSIVVKVDTTPNTTPNPNLTLKESL